MDLTIPRAQIQARRNALAADLEAVRAEHDRLEGVLLSLRRQLDAMHGGLLELDALLALTNGRDDGNAEPD